MIYRRLFVSLKSRPNIRFASKLSYAHAVSNIPLSTQTIDEHFRVSVERNPDKELLVFRQQQIRRTYSQVYQDVSFLI
jgi:hypothetical protein